MLGAGLLVIRLALGALMVAHAGQKLFGWLDGPGLRGTAGYFEQIGFSPGLPFATAAASGELVSGLLILLGLLGPVGPGVLLAIMITAAVSVHRGHGVFAGTNGIEVPLLYATGALGLALAGYGRYSVDHLIGLDAIWTPSLALMTVALGLGAGAGSLSVRGFQDR
jgi:putative oxidoreductase